MSPNLRALKDKAHALMCQGKISAAGEVYRELISEDRKDPALRLHHAELCRKLGRVDRAVASFRVAAHLFHESGRNARARAAIHCALQVSPYDQGLRRAMDELTRASPPRPPPMLSLVSAPTADEEDVPIESGFTELPDDEPEAPRPRADVTRCDRAPRRSATHRGTLAALLSTIPHVQREDPVTEPFQLPQDWGQ